MIPNLSLYERELVEDFVGDFFINLPIPKTMKKIESVPINPESAVETFSFLIHGIT